MSVFGDILVRIFPHSDWIRSRITPNTDTFYKVITILVKDVPECNNYMTLYDTWRRVNHNISKPAGSCDRDLARNGTWYRSDESKILEHVCPNTTSHDCGVDHPGYFTQPHPSVADGVKQMQIHYYRFYSSGNYGTALVRNCASFFVYKFPYLPSEDCSYGICTEYVTRNSLIQ